MCVCVYDPHPSINPLFTASLLAKLHSQISPAQKRGVALLPPLLSFFPHPRGGVGRNTAFQLPVTPALSTISPQLPLLSTSASPQVLLPTSEEELSKPSEGELSKRSEGKFSKPSEGELSKPSEGELSKPSEGEPSPTSPPHLPGSPLHLPG